MIFHILNLKNYCVILYIVLGIGTRHNRCLILGRTDGYDFRDIPEALTGGIGLIFMLFFIYAAMKGGEKRKVSGAVKTY